MAERQSITPTYDRRETGDRFTIETRINGRRLDEKPLPDPFVNHTVHIGWRDLLRGLFHRRLSINIIVSADRELVEDVLELNGDYTGERGSTRRSEWKAELQQKLADFAATREDTD
jgi:hypothetical protein